MITLITGVPGTGKTLHAIWWLHQLIRSWDKKPEDVRPVYVHGVRDLLIPHEVAPDVMEWPEWAPQGALIVIDECQQFFRPRPSGSTPPNAVAQFEVHRHRGLDFWLITQHPNLLDQNIRRLITRHVHLRRDWRGRELLEWSECGNPDSPSSREPAARKRISLPKAAFSLYKSAEVHTKVKLSIPRYALVFALAAVVSVVLGYYVVQAIGRRGGTADHAGPVKTPAQVQAGASASLSPAPSSGSASSVKTVEQYAVENVPRVPGLVHTAPRYDQVTQAKTAPRPAACVWQKSSGVCRCYTQQGTPLAVQPDMCQDIALHGFFVDWDDAAGSAAPGAVSGSAVASPASSGGHEYEGGKRVL